MNQWTEQKKKQKGHRYELSAQKKLHVSSQIQQAYKRDLQQERKQIEKLVEAQQKKAQFRP